MSERLSVYVAGGFTDKEDVRQWMKTLEDNGYRISSDWTKHKIIGSYVDNPEISAQYATEDMVGVKNCDVLILKSKEAGAGANAEFGAAIALGKRVFVVGEGNTSKMFYFHPDVERFENLDEVIQKLKEG